LSFFLLPSLAISGLGFAQGKVVKIASSGFDRGPNAAQGRSAARNASTWPVREATPRANFPSSWKWSL